MAVIWLLACAALKDVAPGKPVLDAAGRSVYDSPRPSEVVYTTAPRIPGAVIPVQVFGLRYALDLVLVSDHPDWVMHEYARIDLPSGPLWMAKDAGVDREQTITAPIEDIDTWVPEVPVRRLSGPVVVEDVSTDTTLKLHIRYVNPKGQPVDVRYEGPLPTQPSNPRNGNTMGHSAKTVAALLDLHLFRIGGKASIRIDGEERKLHKLLGLLPERYLLAQTQGGFAITDMVQADAPSGLTVKRPGVAVDWPTLGTELWTSDGDWLVRDNPVVTLKAHRVAGEIDRMQAWQVGVDVPVTDITFSPALPDVRRLWIGPAESRFVVDIAGQKAHGVGRVETRWVGTDTVQMDVLPEAPAWFASRPIRYTIQYRASDVWVRGERISL